MKIVINGKFMSQPVSGEQRYAREILIELDKLIKATDSVILAVDDNVKDIPKYVNIKVEKIGRFTGVLWEQFSLPLYVAKQHARLICLCDISPVIKPDIIVIHDINFKVNKQYYSQIFSLWHRFNIYVCIRRYKQIITVSEFSKKEICENYHVQSNKISIVPNAWQHFQRMPFCDDTLKKYALTKDSYFFAMSNLSPNKNFKWVAKAAEKNPEYIFAVSGLPNKKVNKNDFDFRIPDNFRVLGRVSDEEAKTLMRDCKAFLFPTFYEGFGIPPMEAMSVGAQCIVSNTSSLPEIYGGSVWYVDPYNYENIDLKKIMSSPLTSSQEVLNQYSWKKSAEKLYKLLYNTVDIHNQK